MYEDFFGLRTKPFQVAPDPSFLYWSENHRMAFTMLSYGVLNASPLTVITGEIGTGKTTLLRHLINEFPAELETGLISNMMAGKGELLEWILMAFNQPIVGTYIEKFKRLQQFILDTYATGKHVMLIVDEAQNLSIDQLEELRMLSNINADRDQLLQMILVGQPELRDMLNRPELIQFAQRITSDFHLRGLDASEVRSYIERRLYVAGAEPGTEIFPPRTCELIWQVTGGVPRLVNILCDLCLVYGFSAETRVIEESLVRELMTGIEDNAIFNQFKPLSSPPKLVGGDEEADRRRSTIGRSDVGTKKFLK